MQSLPWFDVQFATVRPFTNRKKSRRPLSRPTERRRETCHWHDSLEPLERRILMDATAAVVQLDTGFGAQGVVQPVLSQDADHPVADGHFTTFTDAGSGRFYALALNNDYFGGATSFKLMRLNGDGSIDASFNSSPQSIMRPFHWWMSDTTTMEPDSFSPIAIRVQADQKVVVVVRDMPFWTPDPFLVLRFNADGSMDQGFGEQGMTSLAIDRSESDPAVFLTADGKIDLLDVGGGGGGSSWSAAEPMVYLRQLNADGTMDTSVGDGGLLSVALPAMQSTFSSDNQLISQYVSAYSIGATRSDAGGFNFYADETTWTSPDAAASYQTHDELTSLHLDLPGTVSKTAVIKTTDIHFTQSSDYRWSGDQTPGATAMDDTGRLLVFNVQTNQLERYNPDGSRDSAFISPDQSVVTGTLDVSTLQIKPQHDGKICLTARDAQGDFQGIWRLNEDGSTDTTFAGGQAVFGLPAKTLT